jgi:hypothetical protein
VIHCLRSTNKIKGVTAMMFLRLVMPGMKELSDRKRGKFQVMIMFFINILGEGGATDIHAPKFSHR